MTTCARTVRVRENTDVPGRKTYVQRKCSRKTFGERFCYQHRKKN